MKQLVPLILLLGMAGSGTVFAACLNNDEGKEHQVARPNEHGTLSKNYLCPRKKKEVYKGEADRFYDGNNCKYCGCSSDEHTLGLLK